MRRPFHFHSALIICLVGYQASDRVCAQNSDPIIPGITVEITDVVSFPDTRGQGAEDSRSAANVARINFLRDLPGFTNEWFVNDLRGAIYRVNPTTQQVTEYLDVGDEFSRFIIGPRGLSTGVLTVTPHPDFASNGKFYTIHEEEANGNPSTPDFQAVGNAGNLANGQHGVVIEWTATDPASPTFGGTHRELMRIAQPAGNLHNLGDIGFNPHADPGDADYGMMYLAGGDAGYDSEGKGSDQAELLNSIFGKVLRIDPAGNNSVNGAYGVPGDNPYATDGNAATLGEIYASGFRNLHRISWDLASPFMLGTDVGQGAVEEVNFIQSGGDYGWDQFEGTFHRGGGSISGGVDTSPYVWPAAQYDHGDGFAIAGGFVYRGTGIPELVGKFVFGDIVNGRVFYSDLAEMVGAHFDGDFATTADVYELLLTQDGQSVTLKDLVMDARTDGELPNNRVDLRFGQTTDGEIYLSTKQDGWIRQLVGEALAGDFDTDGDIDGTDFLTWQKGLSPIPFSDAQLAQWQANYSAIASVGATRAPEPTSLALAVTIILFFSQSRH